jgi:hypothetical protein
MDALLMMVLVLVGYIVMYRLYGRFIGQKIFAIAKDRLVPAKEFEDGVDFVPTKKEVIFGHHYASRPSRSSGGGCPPSSGSSWAASSSGRCTISAP